MWTIGITGSSGSGKSTVAQLLAKRGFLAVDVDMLAKGLTLPGQPAIKGLKRLFGPQVLGPDGRVDRPWLAARVFGHPAELARLDRLMIPLIVRALKQKLAALKRQGARKVAVDMAILFKAGADALVDDIIVVKAPLKQRIHRLRGRGLPPAAAARQAGAFKLGIRDRGKVDLVLANTGALSDLQLRLDRYLKQREKYFDAA